MAERAIGRHVETFPEPVARSAAPDALASDPIALGQADSLLARLFGRVDEYIVLVRRQG